MRQVHLANWFQGTGIRQKVNGQQVRLLLCSPSCWLSPPKRTELPLVSQPSSPVFSAPQQDEKEPARTKVVCSPLAWAFKAAKITQIQSENRRVLTSQGQLRGEEMVPALLSRIPASWLVHTLGAGWPQPWCPDRGDMWPQVGGLSTMWVSPRLHGSGSHVRGDHKQSWEKGKNTWVLHCV